MARSESESSSRERSTAATSITNRGGGGGVLESSQSSTLLSTTETGGGTEVIAVDCQSVVAASTSTSISPSVGKPVASLTVAARSDGVVEDTTTTNTTFNLNINSIMEHSQTLSARQSVSGVNGGNGNTVVGKIVDLPVGNNSNTNTNVNNSNSIKNTPLNNGPNLDLDLPSSTMVGSLIMPELQQVLKDAGFDDGGGLAPLSVVESSVTSGATAGGTVVSLDRGKVAGKMGSGGNGDGVVVEPRAEPNGSLQQLSKRPSRHSVTDESRNSTASRLKGDMVPGTTTSSASSLQGPVLELLAEARAALAASNIDSSTNNSSTSGNPQTDKTSFLNNNAPNSSGRSTPSNLRQQSFSTPKSKSPMRWSSSVASGMAGGGGGGGAAAGKGTGAGGSSPGGLNGNSNNDMVVAGPSQQQQQQQQQGTGGANTPIGGTGTGVVGGVNTGGSSTPVATTTRPPYLAPLSTLSSISLGAISTSGGVGGPASAPPALPNHPMVNTGSTPSLLGLNPINTSPVTAPPGSPLYPLDEDSAVHPMYNSVSAPVTPLSPSGDSVIGIGSGGGGTSSRGKRFSVKSIREGSNDHLTGTVRRLVRQKSEREVLVGTPVKEGHVNYMLMYDMLTGIRVSVSRCDAKPQRETGNELTPSARYDFKFKDYAPWVFRHIRENFRIDSGEYLLSLTGKYVLSELGSPGKSGSFFYFSQDYRFIIKTIHHSEHKFIRQVLKNYYSHVKANPETLLSRIFGLHRVKLPGNRKIHFVVMGNVFPSNYDIHETYDLKGSTVGRKISEEQAKANPRAVLKDLNWLERGKKLHLGPRKREVFVQQMERDVEFLVSMKIMDYSLLIGCHDLVKGNKDNIRDSTLAVFEPNPETLSRHQSLSNRRGSKASAMRRVLAESDPIKLGPSSSRLPEDSPAERRFCVFYHDLGGFQATDEMDRPGQEVYYIGIIDIFTKYNGAKKVENFFKSITNDKTKISAVNPILYGARFLSFMKSAIAALSPSNPTGTGTSQSFTMDMLTRDSVVTNASDVGMSSTSGSFRGDRGSRRPSALDRTN
ncbi:Phosphatidylinositol-4-phosphate 5-kinase [Blyttiomyces sp. JEL0837]|nr:Phosphatidylinositol-4-phosphate 5-kinase [Blyttiomyces sp. JEL0837]